ncbi:MAG: Crp/Fnr family transcriptional regulator [Pedobacter sp.]|nr:MAG: Crp/Fnr family transcriptional regulator [Pedobacter sp.]
MECNDNQSPDLRQILGKITPLSANFQQRLQEQLLTEHYPQRHCLLRPGEIAKRIYFIRQGFLRAFSIDRNGRETTSRFFSQGELMTCIHSFFNQQPAEEYIQVLNASTLQSLSWNKLNSFYADFPESNLVGRILLQKHYTQSEKHHITMRIFNPVERYQALLSLYPKIEQQTTQTNIASYLGLSRETLSRMKSRLIRARQNMNASEIYLNQAALKVGQ